MTKPSTIRCFSPLGRLRLLEFEGSALLQGSYQPIQPDERGWLWSVLLQLFLGLEEGQLVPTPETTAQLEQAQRQAAEALLA